MKTLYVFNASKVSLFTIQAHKSNNKKVLFLIILTKSKRNRLLTQYLKSIRYYYFVSRQVHQSLFLFLSVMS